MLSLVITIAMLLLAILIWIIVINTSKSKQTALPLLLIHEGFGLLGSGILDCFDFNISLNINTKFGIASGYAKSPDTNYVLLGCGTVLIIFGIILWRSIGTRIYVLNMLGKVKHEISDIRSVNALKIKDYQLKETILDLRWAANDVNPRTWEKAKAQIEEYVSEFSARSDASTVCFTGMAPIPFEVYAGSCMNGNTTKRFFEYKRSEDTYYELIHKCNFSPIEWIKNKKMPALTEGALAGGDSAEVVIAVSITQTVQDSDLTQFNCPTIRFGINNPKDNAITTIMQLKDYVDKTNELIIKLKNVYPKLSRIHLVCAVPSCYAFDLGGKLGHLDNRLPEIMVHHYVSTATPKYKYGIIVTGENKGNLLINDNVAKQ
ncbi:MAG: SAVED domain-containing protein [Desulfotomaculaceae bacterium]|nr:SAVED domain-containing protein [Desulfotomaculaceae bacterium]